MIFEKFPVVVGGCFCDYSFSSGHLRQELRPVLENSLGQCPGPGSGPKQDLDQKHDLWGLTSLNVKRDLDSKVTAPLLFICIVTSEIYRSIGKLYLL